VPTEIPKIFISHAWEDKPFVQQLEETLKAEGLDVWVDHSEVRGGDLISARVNDALEWCNTLLLIWSRQASESKWVQLEWAAISSDHKRIVPCLLDDTKLPILLRNRAYIDLRDRNKGIASLLNTLKSSAQSQTLRKKPTVHLRALPLHNLSDDKVKKMLQEKELFDSRMNERGKGLPDQYELIEYNGQKLVLDHTTGLAWQQSGALNKINYADVEKGIRELNIQNFAGFNDWHLPTLEEVMSLMKPERKNDNLYIDAMFDPKQRWIWTADKKNDLAVWMVVFGDGSCGHGHIDGYSYVRAVRSRQSGA